jgi:hypothetical protein
MIVVAGITREARQPRTSAIAGVIRVARAGPGLVLVIFTDPARTTTKGAL